MGTVITVTAGHIADGRPSGCSDCPIALAVHDAFPHASDIRVSAASIYMSDAGRHVHIPLPDEAADFIVSCDDQNPVEPFSFTVEYQGASA